MITLLNLKPSHHCENRKLNRKKIQIKLNLAKKIKVKIILNDYKAGILS